MSQNGIAVPQHVAIERQRAAQQLQMIGGLRVEIAKDIFSKLAAQKHVASIQAAAMRAKEEVDPFDTKSREEIENEAPAVFTAIDLNPEAEYSIHSANTLLHHFGMLKAQAEAVNALQSPPEEKAGIVLN